MFKRKTLFSTSGVFSAGAVILLAGCSASSDPSAAAPVTAAEEAHAAELVAKEQELTEREAALARKEQQDLARRNAELAAAKAAAAKVAAAPATANVRTASVTPAATRIVVPAGTPLMLALTSNLSTKTAHPGDRFRASLVSDLMINGHRAAPAGARVTGTITNVVSGSNKIGGVPSLALQLNRLVLRDGQKVAITGAMVQQGKSDTGRDTAKILGGAAAGAIIGHQVGDDRRGTVIGGILGGTAGAVAAKKTGTEVELPAGSKLTIEVAAPFEVTEAA